MLAKAAGDSSEFIGRFGDVLVLDGGCILQNQLLDLFFECIYFFDVQTYFALLFTRPYEGAVERLRGKIGCEEGDGVKTKCPCGIDWRR
jgi:hypothetical protein